MNTPEGDRTIEDKRIIEKWENEQDYGKVKELADRGESFQDIQSAMNKGLLLKEDAIRRQGLIERGLAAVMPKTKLESGLLSNLKSKFDPRSMVGNVAKNFALRKMGLSWLNPLMGLASLFGLPQKAKSMIASRRAPAFDPAKARQLGLYADRFPTGTTQFAKRVGDRKTTPEKIVSGEVDLAKLITGGISPELQKLMAKGKSYSETDIIPSKYAGADLAKFAGSDYDVKTSLEKNPELHQKMNDAATKAQNDYLGKIKSGEIPFPDNLQLEMDKVGNAARHNIMQSDQPDIFSETLQEGLDKSNIQQKQKRSREQELLKEIGLARGGRIDKPLTGRSRYL